MAPEELDTLLDWIVRRFHRRPSPRASSSLIIVQHEPVGATATHIATGIVAAWVVDHEGRHPLTRSIAEGHGPLPDGPRRADFAERAGTDTICVALSWGPRLKYGVVVRVQRQRPLLFWPVRSPQGLTIKVVEHLWIS
jgi:hypothetical protein